MKKTRSNKLKIAFAIVLMFGVNLAHSKDKIGIVNFNEVFSNMKETHQADSALHAFFTERQSIIQEMKFELDNLVAKFEKDSATLTASQKADFKNKLYDKSVNITIYEQQAQSEFEAEKEKLNKPILDKIQKAINEVAKEGGYSLILYKDSAAFYKEKMDVTNKVKLKVMSSKFDHS